MRKLKIQNFLRKFKKSLRTASTLIGLEPFYGCQIKVSSLYDENKSYIPGWNCFKMCNLHVSMTAMNFDRIGVSVLNLHILHYYAFRAEQTAIQVGCACSNVF